MQPVTAYLGLGSNLGDREANLRGALEALGRAPGIRVAQCSAFRETAAMGDGPPQGPFLNGAVRIETVLEPMALLAVCKAIEGEAGRELPARRDHPRPLDLDVLLYGDAILDTRDLVVPHPRLRERAFVTAPLAELGIDVASVPVRERPRVVRDPVEFAVLCSGWGEGGCRTGLVPTMGALHEGHRSLMRRARAECDRVAVTIFVNPLQFGRDEDLDAYPRDLPGDLAQSAGEDADAVFTPEVEAMFPDGFCSRLAVGREAEGLEGAVRAGHFAGVATVVARLLALARPHRAYFGQKDAQQVAVIRRLTRDLGFATRIVECPIVREPDGLAMSSRNVFLGRADRAAAPVLHRALQAARAAHRKGERDGQDLLAAARAVLAAEPRAGVDYLELRTEGDLQPPPPGPVEHGRMLVAASFTGGPRTVRLIDNLSLAPPPADGQG